MLCSFPESTNPEKAAAVVNKLMSLYVENNLLSNRAEARRVTLLQLPKTEATVRQEVALRQFKEQNQVVALRRSQIGSSGY